MIDSPMECRVQGSAVCHPGNNLELQSLGMLPDQLSRDLGTESLNTKLRGLTTESSESILSTQQGARGKRWSGGFR
jgi:hypothetical protein